MDKSAANSSTPRTRSSSPPVAPSVSPARSPSPVSSQGGASPSVSPARSPSPVSRQGSRSPRTPSVPPRCSDRSLTPRAYT